MKTLSTIIKLSLIIILFLPLTVSAASIEVGYSGYPDPLFNEINIIPGYKIEKKLRIKNNDSTNQLIGIKLETKSTNRLKDSIYLSVKRGTTVLASSRNLTDYYNDIDETRLDILLPGEIAEYGFIAEIDPALGNEFQGEQEVFSLTLGFVAQETEEEPTPRTPVVTLPPIGTGLAAPILPTEEVAGVTDEPEIVGNIEGQDILGTEDDGVEGSSDKICPWWWIIGLLLLIVLGFTGGMIKAKDEKDKLRKYWYIWPPLYSGIAWVLHYLLHKGFAATWFCDNYWLIVILIAIIFEFIYHFLAKKQENR